MNIQNRMDSSLMMDRAVRKERQKLRSHTKSYRVSGQGADNSKSVSYTHLTLPTIA